MFRADTNRFSLPRAAQQSIVYIFHIKFSPLQLSELSCLLFSVHNRCGGVKLRLPHQEEKADTGQTVSPTLPTLFMTARSVFLFLPTLRRFFSSLSSALSCVLRLGTDGGGGSEGGFRPFPPLKAWKNVARVRLSASYGLAG